MLNENQNLICGNLKMKPKLEAGVYNRRKVAKSKSRPVQEAEILEQYSNRANDGGRRLKPMR